MVKSQRLEFFLGAKGVTLFPTCNEFYFLFFLLLQYLSKDLLGTQLIGSEKNGKFVVHADGSLGAARMCRW